MRRRFGWVQDPHDAADWSFTAEALRLDRGRAAAMALPTPPPGASIKHLLGAPLDQGSLSSCTAHAIAKAIYASHRRYVLAPIPISPMAVWFLSRATHHAQKFDSGTYLRAGFQVINTFGFCSEAEWPYDVTRFATQPPPRVFWGAADQSASAQPADKPAKYRRIWETGAACVTAAQVAIAGGYAVVCGADVSKSFARDEFDPRTPIDPAAGELAGGHAFLLGGYDADGFFLMNSWGRSWGDGGWCKVTNDFVGNRTRDRWVVEHAPVMTAGAAA